MLYFHSLPCLAPGRTKNTWMMPQDPENLMPTFLTKPKRKHAQPDRGFAEAISRLKRGHDRLEVGRLFLFVVRRNNGDNGVGPHRREFTRDVALAHLHGMQQYVCCSKTL